GLMEELSKPPEAPVCPTNHKDLMAVGFGAIYQDAPILGKTGLSIQGYQKVLSGMIANLGYCRDCNSLVPINFKPGEQPPAKPE
ncbi:MAG TPA: hypothetical protein VJ873_09395, partial [bacterium]|nr:hypothetical protein [bacterium]